MHDGLRAFNDAMSAHHRDVHAGVDPVVPLDVYLRGNDEVIGGGVTASTFWGWLEIEHLWVDGTLRGRGFGRRLLLAAEAEARRRGCKHSHLTTYSFQARGFYEKLGYRVVGQLDDFPPGGAYYTMRKDFTTASPTILS